MNTKEKINKSKMVEKKTPKKPKDKPVPMIYRNLSL